MKLKFLSPLLPFLLTSLMMSSCRAPKDLEYKDFKNFKIENLGFASSTVKLELIYFNPNGFGLQLKRTELDIFVNESYLGHSVQEYQVNIPKRGDFTLPVQMEVEMKNLFKNLLSSLLNKEVMVKVTGTITLGKLNVFKTFPVNYEGKQTLNVF